MPWDADDAHRHNKAVPRSGKKARQWAHVADSTLKRTGDEGLAIREANGVVKKRKARSDRHPRSHDEFMKLGND